MNHKRNQWGARIPIETFLQLTAREKTLVLFFLSEIHECQSFTSWQRLKHKSRMLDTQHFQQPIPKLAMLT